MRKILTASLVGLSLLACAGQAVALEDSRVAKLGFIKDQTGDVAGSDLSEATRKALDIRSATVAQGLTWGGPTVLSTVRLQANPKTNKVNETYTVQYRWGTAGSAAAVYTPSSGSVKLTGGPKAKSCQGVKAETKDRAVYVSVPTSCLGGYVKYRFYAASSAVGGGSDRTAFANSSVYNQFRYFDGRSAEKPGDVVYDAQANPAGESADIFAFTTTKSDDAYSVDLGLSDAAYWQWDPRQKYTVTFQDKNGVVHTLSGEADRTQSSFDLVGETCEGVGVVNEGEQVALTIYRKSCDLPKVYKTGVKVETLNADGEVIGQDSALSYLTLS